MRELGLQGAIRGRRFKTTTSDAAAARPPDLVDRDVTATAIVSEWTSRPTHRLFLMTGCFRMWLCVVQCSNSQRNPRAANRSRSFHRDLR